MDSQYVGFDSRLSVSIVARLPFGVEKVLGFEVVNGKPMVLLKSRLLIYDADAKREIVLPGDVTGFAVEASGAIRVQSAGGLHMAVGEELQPDTSMDVQGKLYNAGDTVFLDAYPDGQWLRLVLRRPDGTFFGIAGVEGKLRAASWSNAGLAAIVERTLYLWPKGALEFGRLFADEGLKNAKDVCLVSGRQAVVAMTNAVLSITDEDQVLLAGFTARVRWSDGKLYLLDEHTGEIWGVSGVEQIGRFKDDEGHALRLLDKLPQDASEGDPLFLEAARIIGCDEARRRLASQPNRR